MSTNQNRVLLVMKCNGTVCFLRCMTIAWAC